MNRWTLGVVRVLLAFAIVLLASIVSVFVCAILHSQNGFLSGIVGLAAAICLFLFLERAFPSVYSDLRRPRPWWQTRAAEAPAAIAFAFIVSILSSKIATLWFGLLAISAVVVALLLHATAKNRDSIDLLAKAALGTESHLRTSGYIHSQLPIKPQPHKQKGADFGSTQNRVNPPFSISGNCAMDVRNLAALCDWYKAKIGLRHTYTEREDDSGRPFVDLRTPHSEAFLSLVELPPGAAATKEHVIFFAKNLEKAHRWLTERGVLVEPITTDSGGNRLFRFHDLEGNTIEVCTEPG